MRLSIRHIETAVGDTLVLVIQAEDRDGMKRDRASGATGSDGSEDSESH
jgi:hypothetical protein